MFYFILFFIIGYYRAVADEYKTYENYKVFEIDGDVNSINELVKTMTEQYVSIFFFSIVKP